MAYKDAVAGLLALVGGAALGLGNEQLAATGFVLFGVFYAAKSLVDE